MSYIKDSDIGGSVVRGRVPKASSPAMLSKIPNAESRLDPASTAARSEQAYYAHQKVLQERAEQRKALR